MVSFLFGYFFIGTGGLQRREHEKYFVGNIILHYATYCIANAERQKILSNSLWEGGGVQNSLVFKNTSGNFIFCLEHKAILKPPSLPEGGGYMYMLQRSLIWFEKWKPFRKFYFPPRFENQISDLWNMYISIYINMMPRLPLLNVLYQRLWRINIKTYKKLRTDCGTGGPNSCC